MRGTDMLQTPLVWYGGKTTLLSHIIPLIPPHTRYIEACCGGMALLIAKKPSKIEVANDKNRLIYTFWRVLRDPGTGAQLRDALYYTEYGREQYELCQSTWRTAQNLGDVEWVRRWFVATQQSFTHEETRDSAWRGEYPGRSEASVWANKIDRLAQVAHRLRKVALECMDAAELIPQWNDPENLIFIDPPYSHNTRTEGNNYDHEMMPEQHQHLLELANSTEAQVILTGYSSPMYEQALREPMWQRVQVERPSQIHNNEQAESVGTRTEVIWVKQHTLASIWHVDGLS